MKNNLTILLDNGHGAETPGKRSPDGRLLEYRYTRQIAAEVQRRLAGLGIDARLLVPEDDDVPLAERCRRANEITRLQGRDRVVLASVHVNAAGDGRQWQRAQGWEVWVAPRCSESSRQLATLLAHQAERQGLKVRRHSQRQAWREGRFAITGGTQCPAVLTENLFMDNLADATYLLTDQGREAITRLHVAAITEWAKQQTYGT